MIKAENGTIVIEGNGEEILNEVSNIMGSMKSAFTRVGDEQGAEAVIMAAVRVGFKEWASHE